MGRTDYFDANNYEFNPESPDAVYIIHGFTSTTYEVRELAEFLGNKGYHVKADNLPGHGTNINDCNRVKYPDWLQHVEQGVAEMAAESESVFVVGMSMGGVLGLHLASLFPINGLVIGATVIEFINEKNLKYFNSWLHPIFPKLKKKRFYDKKEAENMIFYGYDNYPMKALQQFYKMNKHVKSELKSVKCPLYIIHAEDDKTSKDANVDIINNGVSSNSKQVLRVRNANHHLFNKSPDQEQIFDNVHSFIEANRKMKV